MVLVCQFRVPTYLGVQLSLCLHVCVLQGVQTIWRYYWYAGSAQIYIILSLFLYFCSPEYLSISISSAFKSLTQMGEYIKWSIGGTGLPAKDASSSMSTAQFSICLSLFPLPLLFPHALLSVSSFHINYLFVFISHFFPVLQSAASINHFACDLSIFKLCNLSIFQRV